MPYNGPLLIAGPTAVGKSAVALKVAQAIGGEIISVDSMQVYRGMNIGTAKPSPSEAAAVRHHLIDVVDLNQSFDAAEFVKLAKTAVADIAVRGRIPVFCGGTGLYFQAYLHGLGEAPPSDHELKAELAKVPLPDLLEELRRADPVTFQTIDRANPRRVLRALEVIRLTGRTFSEQRALWTPHARESDESSNRAQPLFVGLERDKEDLRRRIDRRVDAMFQAGLVAEVEGLLTRGLRESRTGLQGLGYKQVADHLSGGKSLDETIALIKQKTWHFAKHQMTWFRHQADLTWIRIEASEPAESVAKALEARYLRHWRTPGSGLHPG